MTSLKWCFKGHTQPTVVLMFKSVYLSGLVSTYKLSHVKDRKNKMQIVFMSFKNINEEIDLVSVDPGLLTV